jgi:hypothetical protein
MRKSLLCLLITCSSLFADEDSFREKFADPATRTEALAELVPGTQVAYFHTALDHQLAGRTVQFQKTLADWKAATQRKEGAIPATGMDVLENRQLLISYQKDPVGSLAEMVRRYGLKFDDARPNAAAATESLPTQLDPALLTEAEFENLTLNSGGHGSIRS